MNFYLKPIPGFYGIYSASTDGRIYSHSRVDARGHRRNGKWLKQMPDTDGYPRVHLCVDSLKRKWQVHRLVAMAFIQNSERKPEVNHRDAIKTNNCADNLEWATSQENIKHAYDLNIIGSKRNPLTGQFTG